MSVSEVGAGRPESSPDFVPRATSGLRRGEPIPLQEEKVPEPVEVQEGEQSLSALDSTMQVSESERQPEPSPGFVPRDTSELGRDEAVPLQEERPANANEEVTLKDRGGATKTPTKPPSSIPWVTKAGTGDTAGLMIGKCRIEKELGRGGMGAVYLATHARLNVPVAVKVLPSHLAQSSPEFVARFVREAQLAAKIRHPNVVSVLDVDQDESTGQYYIVQEYVGGGSVNDLLKKGPIPVDRALEIAIGVAEALKAASEFRIIHRDIKPDNILLTERGVPKLADLGLAKSTGEDSGMTMTGELMGTPAYMAPEQVEASGSVDARADIYSLGATLFHMVTGKRPYTGPTPMSVMMKHLQEPLPQVKQVKADVPDPVAAAIEKMLAKKVEDRYQSAAELADALKDAKAGKKVDGEQLEVNGGKERVEGGRLRVEDGRLRVEDGEKKAEGGQLVRAGTQEAIEGDKKGEAQGTRKGKWVALALVAAVLGLGGVGVILHQKGTFAPKVTEITPPGYEGWANKGKDEFGYWGENEYRMKFRYIAPGSVAIGTNRVLAVTNGYWIQTTEVTQGQWTSLGVKNPSAFTNGVDYPVEQVSWVDCNDFAKHLGRGYRLPTGDEWEYACRAGSETTYSFGDSATFLDEYAWHSGNAGGKTHPVGTKKPNAWGLHDMHGNAWEWVADELPGSDRVFCGGRWDNDAGNYTSACRTRINAGFRNGALGFRLLRTTSSLLPKKEKSSR